MLRKIPSLEATEAFLFAGRCQSFRAAAEALALSPSAFSRRIQQLERFVGVSLFDRSGPGVSLTEAGRRYLADIEPAVEIIRRATAALGDADGAVRLATSHSFALGWLMPRLPSLMHETGAKVELLTGRGVEALRSGQADVAIYGGAEPPGDHPSEVLLDMEGVVVSAPTLADGRPPPRRLEDLHRHRLLGTRTPPNLWDGWLARAGAPKASDRPVSFDTLQLMYEAAAGGLGVTLAGPIIAERFLREQRLQLCFDGRWPLGMQYQMAFADNNIRNRIQVRRFSEWLRVKITASFEEFHSICDNKYKIVQI